MIALLYIYVHGCLFLGFSREVIEFFHCKKQRHILSHNSLCSIRQSWHFILCFFMALKGNSFFAIIFIRTNSHLRIRKQKLAAKLVNTPKSFQCNVWIWVIYAAYLNSFGIILPQSSQYLFRRNEALYFS